MIESATIRARQFDAANGGNPFREEQYRPGLGWTGGDYFYFANGAKRQVSVLGELVDPPADPVLRATNILRYWTLRLNRAVWTFQERKRVILRETSPTTFATYHEQYTEELEKLVAAVKEIRQQQQAAQVELQKAKNGGREPGNWLYIEATGERKFVPASVLAAAHHQMDTALRAARNTIERIEV